MLAQDDINDDFDWVTKTVIKNSLHLFVSAYNIYMNITQEGNSFLLIEIKQ